jgi:hypothetical protein
MRNNKPTDWSHEMLEILLKFYPTEGWNGIQKRYLAIGVSLGQNTIQRQAAKRGIQCKRKKMGPNYRNEFSDGETASKPGAPQRYYPEWQPLKIQEGLPVRPGSQDWKALPSKC